jgi:DDB1- and CUL4-associated factor 11
MQRPTFCGQFSEDGQRFFSACQGRLSPISLSCSPISFLDYFIRLFDTSSPRSFNRVAEIEAEDVGWSILDTALSPDKNSLAYSTWSDCSK